MRKQVFLGYVFRFVLVYTIGFIALSSAKSLASESPAQKQFQEKVCARLLSRLEGFSRSVNKTVLEVARLSGRPFTDVEIWLFENLKISVERLVSVELISMAVHPNDPRHWEYKFSIKVLIHDPSPDTRMRFFSLAGQKHREYSYETSFLGPAQRRNGLVQEFAAQLDLDMPNLRLRERKTLVDRFEELISDAAVFEGLIFTQMDIMDSHDGSGNRSNFKTVSWVDVDLVDDGGGRYQRRVGLW